MFQNQKNLLNPFSSMACFVQMKIYMATFYIKEMKVSDMNESQFGEVGYLNCPFPPVIPKSPWLRGFKQHENCCI